MHNVSIVLFKDGDGNTVASVEWDTDEWLAYCDVDEDCEWTVRGSSLGDVVHVLAAHVEAHSLVAR